MTDGRLLKAFVVIASNSGQGLQQNQSLVQRTLNTSASSVKYGKFEVCWDSQNSLKWVLSIVLDSLTFLITKQLTTGNNIMFVLACENENCTKSWLAFSRSDTRLSKVCVMARCVFCALRFLSLRENVLCCRPRHSPSTVNWVSVSLGKRKFYLFLLISQIQLQNFVTW